MLHLHQPNVGFKCNWSAQRSLLYFTLRLELHSLSVLAPAFPAKMYQPLISNCSESCKDIGFVLRFGVLWSSACPV